MTSVGFAGLGRMGAPMASNVARAGFPLVVWNRSADKAEAVARSTGASAVPTPRELAERSDVVITMLADDEASAQVNLGEHGVLAGETGAPIVLQMGTHSPGHIRHLASQAGARSVVDAPVSGSIDAARDARLLIMVGTDEATIEAVRPVLEAMAKEIICFDRCGDGATMKLAINLLIHGLNQSVAESLRLAEAAGIAPADAYRAIERSAAAAPMLAYRKPQYLDGPSSPVSFALSLARKDVALALELAASVDVTLPQTELNLDQLRSAEAAGFGDRDMASILGYLESSA